MTDKEYNSICAKIDAILSDLGPEFSEDDPRIEHLLRLSDEADVYYKERHVEGYVDIELVLGKKLIIKIIHMARERNLCTNEFIEKCLEAFVNQHVSENKMSRKKISLEN